MYDLKPSEYFDGRRVDYVDELATAPEASILEIGCGSGQTGQAALAAGKCARYCGVELQEHAAQTASERLTEVYWGDIEEITLPWAESSFDALILSEVLEHLREPWTVLAGLRPLLRTGARVFASSPNVSHHRIIRALIRGSWDLADFGPMDRTHLRWFTPSSFSKMFTGAGYSVLSVRPLVEPSARARVVSAVTRGRLEHLFWGQIDLRATVS